MGGENLTKFVANYQIRQNFPPPNFYTNGACYQISSHRNEDTWTAGKKFTVINQLLVSTEGLMVRLHSQAIISDNSKISTMPSHTKYSNRAYTLQHATHT